MESLEALWVLLTVSLMRPANTAALDATADSYLAAIQRHVTLSGCNKLIGIETAARYLSRQATARNSVSLLSRRPHAAAIMLLIATARCEPVMPVSAESVAVQDGTTACSR